MLILAKKYDCSKASKASLPIAVLVNQGQLETFDWWMKKFALASIEEKTRGGSIWTELHQLKVLRLHIPVFRKSSDLFQVLKQQQADIISLSLSNLCLDETVMPGLEMIAQPLQRPLVTAQTSSV